MTTADLKSKTGYYRDDSTGGFWIEACCVGRENTRRLLPGRKCPLQHCTRHAGPNADGNCDIAHCACHGPSSQYRPATKDELAAMWEARRMEDAVRASSVADSVAKLLPNAVIIKLDDSSYWIDATLPNGVKVRLLADSSSIHFTEVQMPRPPGRYSAADAAALAQQIGKMPILVEIP